MGVRSVTFAQDEFYHIYNRGTDRRTIYETKADYKHFRELLYLCNTTKAVNMRDIYRDFRSVFEYDRGEPIVSIGAYCLMPNHYHLLVTPLVENGMSLFMGKLGTSYSMYFNKKNERTGALFEGKYKAQHADSDEYLKYLYSYIHLNPVKLIQSDWKEVGINDVASAFQYCSAYEHSSLRNYLGEHLRDMLILDPGKFPMYFEKAAQHEEELIGWLQYEHDEPH